MESKLVLNHYIKQIESEYQLAQHLNHRMMLVIFGDKPEEFIQDLFLKSHEMTELLPPGDILTLGANDSSDQLHIFKKIYPKRVKHHLSWSDSKVRLGGTEAALLIDLSQGLDPDALSANLGVVCGRGLILCLAPDEPPKDALLNDKLRVWPYKTTEVGIRLWTRVWSSIKDKPYFKSLGPNIYLSQARFTKDSADGDKIKRQSQKKDYFSQLQAKQFTTKQNFNHVIDLSQRACLNKQQSQAVAQILYSHQRQAFSAVALSANRGRGKSSVLGISAAALTLLGEREVLITGPSEYACAIVFEKAFLLLKQAQQMPSRNDRQIQSLCGVIRYVSPFELWTRRVKATCLFVDEAATLPLPLLERLLENKPSLVFATTTHGYEGTGRGFSLRFRPLLQKRLRKLYEPRLELPIRWALGDPIEDWSMHVFLLETQLRLKSAQDLIKSAIIYKQVGQDELFNEPKLYEQVFALLINAHYRTQPSDLWRLLDAPNLSLHLLLSNSKLDECTVLAAAIVSSEGGLSPQLSAQIYEGRERPRGQLFAANLAIHLNCEEGAQLKLNRIIRIATQPIIQNQGLGSRLLNSITQAVSAQGVDILGSSFGATSSLVRFWSKNGFHPLRVSVRQSHVSGERSLLVALGLTPRAKGLLKTLMLPLRQELDEQLLTAARDITPELVFHLYTQLSFTIRKEALSNTDSDMDIVDEQIELSDREWKALGAVAFSGRAYELAAGPARRLALAWLIKYAHHCHCPQALHPLGKLLIMKVIQAQGWQEVTQNLALGSTSEAMKGLSAALRLAFFDLAPRWVQEWVERFPQYEKPASLCHALLPNALSTF